jgi:hypothetical protein
MEERSIEARRNATGCLRLLPFVWRAETPQFCRGKISQFGGQGINLRCDRTLHFGAVDRRKFGVAIRGFDHTASSDFSFTSGSAKAESAGRAFWAMSSSAILTSLAIFDKGPKPLTATSLPSSSK